MRTLKASALAALLSTLVLSGCVGSGGMTAMSAADDLDRGAVAWAGDAVLVVLFGAEAHGGPSSLMEQGNPVADALGNITDSALDGRTAGWAGVYYSAERGMLAVFVTGPDGVENVMEQPLPPQTQGEFPEAAIQAARDVRSDWSVDSPQALEALRAANATIDAALADGNGEVAYAIEFMDRAWHIEGAAGNYSFSGEVDGKTGETTDIEVDVRKVTPPGGFPVDPDLPLPPPIHEEGRTSASADPMNLLGADPCSTPSADCEEITFTIGREATIEAELSWGNLANDFDFYILDEDGTVVVQGASEPGTVGASEQASGTLVEGTYTIQIVPWSAAQDSWTFDATFS